MKGIPLLALLLAYSPAAFAANNVRGRRLDVLSNDQGHFWQDTKVTCRICLEQGLVQFEDAASGVNPTTKALQGDDGQLLQRIDCETSADQEPDGIGDLNYAFVNFPKAEMADLLDRAAKASNNGGCAVVTIDHVDKNRFNDPKEIDSIVWINDESSIQDANEVARRRLELPRTNYGEISFLFIRMNGLDHKVQASEETLQNIVSKVGGVFEQCSMDQLTMVPAQDSNGHIKSGVLTVEIDDNCEGVDVMQWINLATQKAEEMLGVTLSETFNHVA